MMILNKDRANLMQKWTILKLKPCFVFLYLYYFEHYGSWTVYQKGKKETSQQFSCILFRKN